MAAGGPYTLTASANGETRTASDVLVGDVFFCSGQSNMAFSQRQAQGAAEDARTATDAANPPLQRSGRRQPDAAPDVRGQSALDRGQPGDRGQLLRGLLLLRARVEEDRERADRHGHRRLWRRAAAQLHERGGAATTRARDRGPRHPGPLPHRPDGGDAPLGQEMGILVDSRPAEGWPALDAGVRRRVVEDRTAGTRRLGAVERHQP